MRKKSHMDRASKLSRRENEVMTILFRRGEATAREVWDELEDRRPYSTLRKQLSILEEKGHVVHRRDGATFVYSPKQRRETAGHSAISRVVDTFFGGSIECAVTSLLGGKASDISAEELENITALIDAAKLEKAKKAKSRSTNRSRSKR